MAAVFPKMLEVCGEIAQGALLVWCTLEHAGTAADHVALGATRAGRGPGEVDMATMIPCAVSDDKNEARDAMRPAVAMYAGFFPRYRRLMGQAGFVEELEAVRQVWIAGDRERAMRLVPVDLIDKVSLPGTADECRAGLEKYRRAGITLPIIFPVVSGPDAKRQAMDAIRACAPP